MTIEPMILIIRGASTTIPTQGYETDDDDDDDLLNMEWGLNREVGWWRGT